MSRCFLKCFLIEEMPHIFLKLYVFLQKSPKMIKMKTKILTLQVKIKSFYISQREAVRILDRALQVFPAVTRLTVYRRLKACVFAMQEASNICT